MKGKTSYLGSMTAMLTAVLMLGACHDSSSSEPQPRTVPVHLTFSLPQRIVATKLPDTRMTSGIVQEDESSDGFRGLRDVRLFCFNDYPTENSSSQSSAEQLKPIDTNTQDERDKTDLSFTGDIDVPVGTTYFSFYARANDAPTTHEERMKYGCLESIGLFGSSYSSNAGIRFRPVPIDGDDDAVKYSTAGQELLALMTKLMNTTVADEAPNDKLSTTNNATLSATYNQLRQLTTASTVNIQVVLGMIYDNIIGITTGQPGAKLAQAMVATITENSKSILAGTPRQIVLLDKYQDFPEHLHLPIGVARMEWDPAAAAFVFPDASVYPGRYGIPTPGDFVYPINLQYQITSDIVASDSLVLFKDVLLNEEQDNTSNPNTQGNPNTQDDPTTGNDQNPDGSSGNARYTSWSELINTAYIEKGAYTSVKPGTRSVAMTKQVQYAVGKLSARVRLENQYLYDAKGQTVNAVNGYTLKGYIVGGQREVDYAFCPVAGTRSYAIYDTDLNGGAQRVASNKWTSYNYILGLGTSSDEPVYLALELVNDGDAFYGAEGLVPHGCTFYLVANLNPKTGEGYNYGTLDQIFLPDYGTIVNLTITRSWRDKNGDQVPDPDLDDEGNPKPLTGLATATYCIPIVPHDDTPPELGVSVNLSWNEGITFNDIPL